MVDTIDSLMGSSEPVQMDSLVPTEQTAPLTSAGANKNAAAHVSMLEQDPNQVLGTYQQIVSERSSEGLSFKEDELTATARQQEMVKRQSTVADMMLDPNLDDARKLIAAQVASNPDHPDLSVTSMVATKSVSKPIPHETNESIRNRDIMGEAIGNVLKYQQSMQKVYNEVRLQDEASYAGIVGAFETMIPPVFGLKEVERSRKFKGEEYGIFETLNRALTPGSSRKDRAEFFNALPLEQRQAVVNKFIDVMNEDGQSFLLPDSMDAPSLSELQAMTEVGAYTTGDKYIDNAFGALDAAGIIGTLLKGAKRIVGVGRAATGPAVGADAFSEAWAQRFTASDVQPSSLSQTVKDVNPEQARQLHALADADKTGDAALATHGTNRDEAIAGDVLPVIGQADGGVQSRIYNPQRVNDLSIGLETDAAILARAADKGYSFMSDAEKASARSKVVNDFQNVVGFANRAEMSSIQATDSGLKMSQVYGPANGGFGDINDAIQQAAFAMRKYGVTQNDIKVLKFDGGEYRVAKAGNEVGDNFLLSVDYNYRFNMDDVNALDEYTVKNNWLDYARGSSWGNGSIQSILLDPQSMLDPRLTHSFTAAGGNVAGVQREFLRSAAEMGNKFAKMKFERQKAINDELINANLRGDELTEATLLAKGYDTTEISVFKDFRRIQDTIYKLDDMDLKQSMRNVGYQVMENASTDTRLFARPQTESSLNGYVRAYDPDTQRLVDLPKDAITDLYKSGGGVAQLRSHLTIDDEIVESIIHYNSPGGNYLRAISDSDQVLAYRKGYYSVRYKDPHFIQKTIRDKNGKEITRAVATASNMKDAEVMAARLRATDGAEYTIRSEKTRDFNTDNLFDTHHAGGRSSQRIRGQRLEDSTGANDMPPMTATNIETPMESMVRSIRSISNRVAMRDVIEAQKLRYIKQYSSVLPQKGVFPQAASEIKAPNYALSKKAADARTAYNYIRAIEHGYRNSLDDSVKGALHLLADAVGVKGFSKTEGVLRAGAMAGGATGFAKKQVYTLLIALSPLRQLVLQSAQGTMLLAHNPSYVTTHLIPDLFLVYHHTMGLKPTKALIKASGKSEEEVAKMFDAFDRSNVSAGISHNTLAKDAFDGIVNDMYSSRRTNQLYKIKRVASKTVEYSRKAGFDLGEFNSSASSFLSHYDKAVKQGRVMNKTGIEKTMAEARNFTFNMDRAGRMPYEANSVALITQFLQVPHKALTLYTFNRTLSASDKFKVAAIATLLYGAPDEIVDNYMSPLFEGLPEEATTAIKDGLFQSSVNYVITKATGLDTEIDFSSFNPFDGYGLFDFTIRAGKESFGDIIARSPAGSMFAGSNPRIMDALRVTGKWVGVVDDSEENPTKAMDAAYAVANMAAGYSYLLKSQMALKYGKLYGGGGTVQDSSVSTPEAYAMLLGLNTKDAARLREASFKAKNSNEESVQAGKDAADMVRKQVFMSQGDPQAFQFGTAIGSFVSNAIKEDPIAYKAYLTEFRKGFTRPEDKFGQLMMQGMGVMQTKDFNRLVDSNPSLNPEQKAEVKRLHQALTSKEGK